MQELMKSAEGRELRENRWKYSGESDHVRPLGINSGFGASTTFKFLMYIHN